MRWRSIILAAAAAAALNATPANAVAVGQLDDFEDGTTKNWVVGLLGAAHPAPPVNVPNGGPGGADDAFLRLTSIGGGAVAGSKLAVINLVQWAGDYTAAGVTGISVDVRNFGPDTVDLRLLLENPKGAPPTDSAITPAVVLASGSDWTNVSFSLAPADLEVLRGSVATLLGDVTVLRFFHGSADAFPGESLTALIGIDNVRALGAAPVPEPGSLALLGLGLAGLGLSRRRRG
jgi:hypothetical protein